MRIIVISVKCVRCGRQIAVKYLTNGLEYKHGIDRAHVDTIIDYPIGWEWEEGICPQCLNKLGNVEGP